MKKVTPRTIKHVLFLLLAGAIAVWSWRGVEFDGSRLMQGMGRAGDTARSMWPPDWGVLPRALQALAVTLQMSIVGTLLGLVFAVPAAFAAARTSPLPRWVSSVMKTALNILRAVPSFIYATVFVSMVGLGPFPGALGIAIGSFVMLGKMFAETLEATHPQPIEAVRAVGGSSLAVLTWGMLPQALPLFVSHLLYAWEVNIGAATILGFVGAGGLGFELIAEINYYNWQRVSVYVLVLIAMVLLADTFSWRVRRSMA
jgi:phosphonate transport system permease protein